MNMTLKTRLFIPSHVVPSASTSTSPATPPTNSCTALRPSPLPTISHGHLILPPFRARNLLHT